MLLTAQKTVFREVIDDRRLPIREQIWAFKFTLSHKISVVNHSRILRYTTALKWAKFWDTLLSLPDRHFTGYPLTDMRIFKSEQSQKLEGV